MVKRLLRAIRRDGIVVAMQKLWAQLLMKLRPGVWRRELEIARRAKEFDARRGVDTAGVVYQTSIDSGSRNQMHASYYKGSDAIYFHDAIAALDIKHSDWTFIDYGSGKGKALLLASAYPFKRIVGVELSDELNRIAQENIRLCCRTDIECHCGDATEFAVPEGQVLCYLFNPFDEVVMSKVLANIRRAHESGKASPVIVYYNPRHGELFDRESWLVQLGEVGPVKMWGVRRLAD